MRTTLDLADDVLAAARALSSESGVSLGAAQVAAMVDAECELLSL